MLSFDSAASCSTACHYSPRSSSASFISCLVAFFLYPLAAQSICSPLRHQDFINMFPAQTSRLHVMVQTHSQGGKPRRCRRFWPGMRLALKTSEQRLPLLWNICMVGHIRTTECKPAFSLFQCRRLSSIPDILRSSFLLMIQSSGKVAHCSSRTWGR